jgi:hypothetical protein
MSRYNFHEQLAKIKKDSKYRLPADINAPVQAFLDKIGCEVGIKKLATAQDHINYGTIELIDDRVPNAKLEIQVDAGMAEGWNQYEVEKIGHWTAISYKSIRNDNLTKKKQFNVTKEQK